MKLLIISDVHSNINALRAVEKDAGAVDAIYCAGDFVDYGTDPCEAIKWGKDHGVIAVSGNHDRYLLKIAATDETDVCRGTGRWRWVNDNIDRMGPGDFDFLRGLPEYRAFSADGIDYIMMHQMKEKSYDLPETTAQFDACWDRCGGGNAKEKRTIFGHTHRRCIHILDDHKLWLNPGSVSYRRLDDNDKRAHYMLITDGIITLHAVEYDRSNMYEQTLEYERSGSMAEDQIRVAKFFFG